MDELVGILNEDGTETKQEVMKSEAHKEGLWHKTVHVYIINDKKELLLQKRSDNKDHYPNVWDISAGGHIAAGEDSLITAYRETDEEIGLKIDIDKLIFLFTTKEDIKNKDKIHRHYDDVYLYQLETNYNFKLQKDEVKDLKWISISDFEKLVKEKSKELFPIYEEFELVIKEIKKI